MGRVDLAIALGARSPIGVSGPRVSLRSGHEVLGMPAVVLDGALLRAVHIGRRAAALLHGAGDIVASGPDEIDPFRARLRALVPSVLVVLDDEAMEAIAAHPELGKRVLAGVERQSEMLMLQAVLAQLTSVSERLEILLPIIAERWGTVSHRGVILPAFLSHSVLAELIGVRRPSFTTALAGLEDPGSLQRLDDRRWLLSPEAAGLAA